MGEKTYSMFLEIPGGCGWPEMGAFLVTKTCGNADAGIVAGDGVTTEKTKEARAEGPCEATVGFRGGETVREAADLVEKLSEGIVLEVMKEKVGEDKIDTGGALRPRKSGGGKNDGLPVLLVELREGSTRNTRLPIDQKKLAPISAVWESEGENLSEEMGVAAAEVGQSAGWRGRIGFFEPLDPEAVLTKNGVQALEVPPAGEGRGIERGKGVENFWGEAAGVHEVTSRRAP